MHQSDVIESCVGFLRSMSEIAPSESIGCQIYARDHITEPVCALADSIAAGAVDTAPITLTVAAIGKPLANSFELRGTHAYACIGQQRGQGAVLLVLLTIAVLFVAIMLMRSM